MISTTMNKLALMPLLFLPALTAEPRNLILNGIEAQPGTFPYFTDLVPDGRDQHCGGALVAPDLVLTHPQCAPLELEARIGWHSRNNLAGVDVINFLDSDTSLAFVHPLYDEHTFAYGFMLVKLSSSSTQSVVKLNNDPAVPAAGTPMTVMGRGNRKDINEDPNAGPIHLGRPENQLDEAPLPYITKQECDKVRTEDGWTYDDTVDESGMLCAGSDDYGACEDDWGAPLVVPNADTSEHLLVGIFGWTYGCRPTPSVFSRVSSAYDWLSWEICRNSANPPAYLNCGSVVQPQIGTQNPSGPPNPINFRWTFAPDDYNFENAVTLERIDGLTTRKVDTVVPGAIPFGFESTYVRDLELEEGALYSITFWDTNQNEFGKVELFLENTTTNEYESFFLEYGSFRGFVNNLFYATLGEVEDAYTNIRSYANSSAGLVTMEIKLDDYPGEIAWQLTTEGGDTIVYRPPRYYFDRAGDIVTETFAMPPERQTYTLYFADTYGDGLQRDGEKREQGYYKLMDPEGNVLVESQFRDKASEETSFVYSANDFDPFDSSANYFVHAWNTVMGTMSISCAVGLILYG